MSADDFKTPTDRAADAMSALREHVGRVAEALDRAGVPALVDHVRRLSLETGEGAYRVPMGLIQTTRDTSCPYDGAVEKLEPLSPSLRIRVSHLVLSPDTAQGFDLVDLRAYAP